jgi:diaminopimelate epimerase
MTILDFQPFTGAGCGNTFLVLSQRFCDRHTDEQIRRLWKESGVDSVLLLQNTFRGDVRMLVPGNDGVCGKESGEFCGNGARVIAAFYQLSFGQSPVIVSRSGKQFPTLVEASVVHIEFPMPEIRGNIVLAGGEPHAIIFHDMTTADLIRFCNSQTRRVSANRLHIHSSNHIQVQTFEHSINKFTGCCGTGCVAMAYLAFQKRQVDRCITVDTPGGQLYLEIDASRIVMSGPADIHEPLEPPGAFCPPGKFGGIQNLMDTGNSKCSSIYPWKY